MVEPTLSLSWDDIRNEVYEYLFGGGDEGFTNETDNDRIKSVERACYSGLRQFYSPPPVDGRTHDWSFLMPTATLSLNGAYSTGTIAYDHTGGANELQVTLSGGTWPSWAASGMIDIAGNDYPVESRVSDTVLTLDANNNPGADVAASTSYNLHQDDYELPDDFGSVLGTFTFAQVDNTLQPVNIVGENRMRELRQRDYNQSYTSGDPFYGAIRPKARANRLPGTRYEVMFWPDVSSDATLTYRYRVMPDKPITGDASADDLIYGITQHGETILYSCLAEGERRMEGERGEMWAQFQVLLQTSVMRDRQDNKTEVFGYNGDASDSAGMYGPKRFTLFSSGVTYKGQGT